jgi:predicted transglutaminase-like cysteine proteinase
MHSEKLVIAMSIDTYGLPSEQYEEFFEDNIRFAAQLYLKTCNILSAEGAGSVDFKTVLDMYQENVYATNDDCRRYQKTNNPEAIKDNDIFGLSPSREELMEEIKSVNAKVEALNDYVAELVAVTTRGLTGIADRLVD